MLAWWWARDKHLRDTQKEMLHRHLWDWCGELAWNEDLARTLANPEIVHGPPEVEGSARSSQQFSDDDDITTCHGCGFFGTFAEVMEHENTCAQIPHTADADIEDPEIESEMSQAETETSQIE